MKAYYHAVIEAIASSILYFYDQSLALWPCTHKYQNETFSGQNVYWDK